jgi:hypothetical protein
MPEAINTSLLSPSEFTTSIQRINYSIMRRLDSLNTLTNKINKTQNNITFIEDKFKILEIESKKVHTEIKELELKTLKKNIPKLEECER